jgi:hypothetical protein
VLEEPVGTPPTEGLLVGDREVDQGSLGTEAASSQATDGDGLRRGEVQHVDRAASPDEPVGDLGRERVSRPPVRVDRNHVGVSHQQQRGRGRIAALDAHHEALTSRLWLVDLVVTHTGEVPGEEVDAAVLLARRGLAVVDAMVADQQRKEFGDLGGGILDAHAHACTIGRSLLAGIPGSLTLTTPPLVVRYSPGYPARSRSRHPR